MYKTSKKHTSWSRKVELMRIQDELNEIEARHQKSLQIRLSEERDKQTSHKLD